MQEARDVFIPFIALLHPDSMKIKLGTEIPNLENKSGWVMSRLCLHIEGCFIKQSILSVDEGFAYWLE